MTKTIDQHISEIKAVSEQLIEFSYPSVPTEQEKDIICLKQRQIFADGYLVNLHYNKSDYKAHFVETFQVYPEYNSYLPFILVCKLAKKTLGTEGLYYLSVVKYGIKIYIWSLQKNKEGVVIPDINYKDSDLKKDEFCGLKFNRILAPKMEMFF